MPSTQFSVQTTMSPAEVMTFITDFGPKRAERWPNIAEGKYEVHDQGDGWAEVTEGNDMGWERERYTWDAATGTIEIETLESNLWGPGSGWKYELTPTDGGTSLHVALTRHGNSLKGRLIGAIIPIFGAKALGKQFQAALRRGEASS